MIIKEIGQTQLKPHWDPSSLEVHRHTLSSTYPSFFLEHTHKDNHNYPHPNSYQTPHTNLSLLAYQQIRITHQAIDEATKPTQQQQQQQQQKGKTHKQGAQTQIIIKQLLIFVKE